MRYASLIQAIARGLLAVMLATVLTPAFGWDMVSGAAPHSHDAAAHEAYHGGHEAHPDSHDGHQDCAPAAQADDGGSATEHPHCCAGHVFGHLIGPTGDALLPAPAGKDVRPPAAASRYRSPAPLGLERPPRPFSA